MNLLKTLFGSPKTSSVIRSGIAIAKNQPNLAPALLGGGLVAGFTAMLIGGYKIFDCIRYQTSAGQCNQEIEGNAPAVVGGIATMLTGWGGFNTYNKNLHIGEEGVAIIPPKELVEDFPVASSFQESEPSPEEIQEYISRGATQQEAADFFNVSRYHVRKSLKQLRNRDRGR
jgi:hypothetical protein